MMTNSHCYSQCVCKCKFFGKRWASTYTWQPVCILLVFNPTPCLKLDKTIKTLYSNLNLILFGSNFVPKFHKGRLLSEIMVLLHKNIYLIAKSKSGYCRKIILHLSIFHYCKKQFFYCQKKYKPKINKKITIWTEMKGDSKGTSLSEFTPFASANTRILPTM